MILAGLFAELSTWDERLLGPWTGDVMGFQLVPFLVICGGLWLVIRKPKNEGK